MRMRFVVFALLSSAPFICSQPSLAQDSPSAESRRIVQRVNPMYPFAAKRINLEGTVKLIAVVAPDGTVKAIESVGGSPILIQAARDAVTKWKYAPAGAESRETVQFHFNPRQE